MQRNLAKLTEQTYDLCIVGGGIYGATLLWEATLRGLHAVLLEKDDFGSATSANSLKTIHGGVRYLQHADIKRMRESMNERRVLMRITPHLVHPLPVLIPTYGHGMKGREIMALAMIANDLLSIDRNSLDDPQKRIPSGRTLSKSETLALLPHIKQDKLTGAALLYDAQVYNSERHILSFVQSAVEKGADAANYAEVNDFLRTGDRIEGVTACDKLTGEQFAVRARWVINTAGPWVNRLIDRAHLSGTAEPVALAKAYNVVVPKLFDKYAVGIYANRPYQDVDAVLKRSGRLLFVSPWRDTSMIGTEYTPYDGNPDHLAVSEGEITAFLNDFNDAYPQAQLTPDDVRFVHQGLLPMYPDASKSGQVQLHKHYSIRDHRAQGITGLTSIIGVKYTTARDVAQHVTDWLFKSAWEKDPPRSQSAHIRLHGGQIDHYDDFMAQAVTDHRRHLSGAGVRQLVANYGSAYTNVLKHLPDTFDDEGTALIEAQTRHAIHCEMAQKLSDIIFRRTELGTAGDPGDAAIGTAARTAAGMLGWDEMRTEHEISDVLARFR